MRSWRECFEQHILEHLGRPRKRFVGRLGVGAENEVLVFDDSDGRQVFCTLGMSGPWPGGVPEEFVLVAQTPEPAELAYVLVNAIREIGRAYLPGDPCRVIALQRRVCPEFIQKWKKTGLAGRGNLQLYGRFRPLPPSVGAS